MLNPASEPNQTQPAPPAYEQAVMPLVADLLYPSESDEALEPVSCPLTQPEPLTVSQLTDWLRLPTDINVDERPEAEFWEPVTTQQDWYSDDETLRTRRFQQLRAFIETTLSSRQVFFVGETEIDVYLLGLNTAGVRAGLKTKVVQT